MKDVARLNILDFSIFKANFCWKSLLGLLSRSRHVTNKIIQDILTVFTLNSLAAEPPLRFFSAFLTVCDLHQCVNRYLFGIFAQKKVYYLTTAKFGRLKTWNAVLIMLKFSLLHHHVSPLDWNNDDSTCLPLWKLAQDCNRNKTGFYILVNSHLA